MSVSPGTVAWRSLPCLRLRRSTHSLRTFTFQLAESDPRSLSRRRTVATGLTDRHTPQTAPSQRPTSTRLITPSRTFTHPTPCCTPPAGSLTFNSTTPRHATHNTAAASNLKTNSPMQSVNKRGNRIARAVVRGHANRQQTKIPSPKQRRYPIHTHHPQPLQQHSPIIQIPLNPCRTLLQRFPSAARLLQIVTASGSRP